MLKVCLSLYTLLRSHLRSHLFVNCCIRRASLPPSVKSSTSSNSCKGDGDVVGVVTHLVREGAQVLHGDQVVALSVLLEVHGEEEGEDGERQIEAERGGCRNQRETHMDDYGDEVRLKNTLSHEVHVTRHQRV